MILQILLIIMLGIMFYVSAAPFNLLIFVSMGIVAVAIGILAIYVLIQAKREKLRR